MLEVLIIRADASTQIGSGHIMRCLALAQAWKKQDGKVIFISTCESESLRNRIIDEGFELVLVKDSYPDPVDFETTLSTLNYLPSTKSWVVLDGYHFDTDYQQCIKNNGNPLLVIDDIAHLNHYVADIILNQNINAEKLSYSCEPETKLLLGTEYVLLRDEYLTYKNTNGEIPVVAKRILITMGGADPENITLKVLNALNQINVEDLEINVVVGTSNPHLNTLKKAAMNCYHKIEVLHDVSNMSQLMAWADLAVSAGGSTCWELAFNGVPSILIVLAKNQKWVAKGLSKYGYAINLGGHNEVTCEQTKTTVEKLISDNVERNMMSNCGRKLIDGQGKRKVTAEMRNVNEFDNIFMNLS